MFEDLKYKIGDRFVYRDPTEEPAWRTNPTIFQIVDIIYSLKNDNISLRFTWYNDSIDSGYGSIDVNDFEEEYRLIGDEDVK